MKKLVLLASGLSFLINCVAHAEKGGGDTKTKQTTMRRQSKTSKNDTKDAAKTLEKFSTKKTTKSNKDKKDESKNRPYMAQAKNIFNDIKDGLDVSYILNNSLHLVDVNQLESLILNAQSLIQELKKGETAKKPDVIKAINTLNDVVLALKELLKAREILAEAVLTNYKRPNEKARSINVLEIIQNINDIDLVALNDIKERCISSSILKGPGSNIKLFIDKIAAAQQALNILNMTVTIYVLERLSGTSAEKLSSTKVSLTSSLIRKQSTSTEESEDSESKSKEDKSKKEDEVKSDSEKDDKEEKSEKSDDDKKDKVTSDSKKDDEDEKSEKKDEVKSDSEKDNEPKKSDSDKKDEVKPDAKKDEKSDSEKDDKEEKSEKKDDDKKDKVTSDSKKNDEDEKSEKKDDDKKDKVTSNSKKDDEDEKSEKKDKVKSDSEKDDEDKKSKSKKDDEDEKSEKKGDDSKKSDDDKRDKVEPDSKKDDDSKKSDDDKKEDAESDSEKDKEKSDDDDDTKADSKDDKESEAKSDDKKSDDADDSKLEQGDGEEISLVRITNIQEYLKAMQHNLSLITVTEATQKKFDQTLENLESNERNYEQHYNDLDAITKLYNSTISKKGATTKKGKHLTSVPKTHLRAVQEGIYIDIFEDIDSKYEELSDNDKLKDLLEIQNDITVAKDQNEKNKESFKKSSSWKDKRNFLSNSSKTYDNTVKKISGKKSTWRKNKGEDPDLKEIGYTLDSIILKIQSTNQK